MLHIFHTYVSNVISGCCLCVAIVFQVFHVFFVIVSDAYFKRFICLHMYGASVLYLDVLKIDWMQHLFPRLLLPCILLRLGRGRA
jgi:hypothetical protein